MSCVYDRSALLLLETALGRKTGQSSIGAFKAFGKKYLHWRVDVGGSVYHRAAYCVIGGWVTKYMVGYAVEARRLWPMAVIFSARLSPAARRVRRSCWSSWR
ncbi:MAG: hypothetical protein ACLT98_13625 [Eggerthellaceae bacterium]